MNPVRSPTIGLPTIGFISLMLLHLSHGQGIAPSPDTAPGPSSDGTMIDQGIAYLLMFMALALTYIFH